MKQYLQGEMHKALGLQITTHTWLVHITYHLTDLREGTNSIQACIRVSLASHIISHLKTPPQQI